MGGIKVDTKGQTCVPGLFATGQAIGGLHGGNRLGTISLAELYVFGKLGEKSPREQITNDLAKDIKKKFEERFKTTGTITPIKLLSELQQVMWSTAGPAKNEQILNEGLKEINRIKMIRDKGLTISDSLEYNVDLIEGLELGFMLILAPIIIESALMRRESRGAHLRLDYPEKDDKNWRCHITWKQPPPRDQ